MSDSDDDDDDKDEKEQEEERKKNNDIFVKIGGLRRRTIWRFPMIKHCPLFGCKKRFKKRSDAAKHFKKTHSSTSVWCEICKQPTIASGYGIHFKKHHPEEPIPTDWRSKVVI